MNKKLAYPLLVLAVGIVTAYLIAVNEPEVTAQPPEPRLRTVRVVEVNAGSEYLTINSQGTVQPRTQSELIPEVSGRVEWISPAPTTRASAFRASWSAMPACTRSWR